jgi:uncharacterized Zn finger protein
VTARRRTFGATWWGRAWLEALEGRAVHDANRLPRGRTYARNGSARDLTVEPGRVRARVRGSRPTPYDVVLQVRELREDEWDCVLDAIVAKAGHAAALLDGELDPGVVADAAAVDVELLPRSGELRTACTCPDWAEPCKHAAAVCYLVADALDADPFVLLQLRGRDRTAVLAGVRARRSGADPVAAAPASPVDPGVAAAEAWARPLGPLPRIPTPPRDGPGRPAPWPSDPPNGAPFTGAGLHRLAVDAARRAWALRTGTGTSGLDLDETTDAARRAASADGEERRDLAVRAGTTEAVLDTHAAAWQVAGADGLRALAEPAWPAPAAEMAEARAKVLDWGVEARSVQVRANRVTVGGDQQLRRSRDGRWYRFERRSGRWTMTAPPAEDVDDLLDLPLGPGGAR